MIDATESDEANTGRNLSGLNRENTETEYRAELINWVQRAIAYFFFFCILQVSLLTDLSVDGAFIPLFALDLKIMIFFVLENRSMNLFRLLLSKELLDQLTSISFKVLLLIHKELRPFNAIILIIPVALSLLNQLFHKVSTSNECQYLTWTIITVCKFLFLITVTNVSLIQENIVNWSLTGAFWPVYLGICISCVFFIGFFFFTLGSWLSYMSDEISKKELLTTFWFLSIIASVIFSLILLCGAATGTPDIDIGKFTYVIPSFVLIFFVITTLCNLKVIINWWVLFFITTQVDSNQGENTERSEGPPSIRNQVISTIKKAPRYLKQISSSYFKPVEKKVPLKKTTSLKEHVEDNTIVTRRTFSDPVVESADTTLAFCCMCLENISNAVIMDCGHGGICYDCSLEMWKNVGHCHMCRGSISQVLQIERNQDEMVKVKSTTRAIFSNNK